MTHRTMPSRITSDHTILRRGASDRTTPQRIARRRPRLVLHALGLRRAEEVGQRLDHLRRQPLRAGE